MSAIRKLANAELTAYKRHRAASLEAVIYGLDHTSSPDTDPEHARLCRRAAAARIVWETASARLGLAEIREEAEL